MGHGSRSSLPSLDAALRPPSPFRLARGSSDRTLRVDRGVATRLLRVDGSPVVVRAWQPAADRVLLRAEAVEPTALRLAPALAEAEPSLAGREQLELAIERMRFALGVDD